MTDRPQDHDTVDDDRLLALALGIDDPELAAAVAARPDLAQRLARARGDIEAVELRLRAAVPAAPDDYAEPSADRWPRLQQYFAPPASGGRHVRRGRGRLVAALAAAALLALVVGIGVVGIGSRQADDRAAPGASGAQGEAAGVPTTDKGAGDVFGAGMPIVLPEAEHFRAVVVARAGEIVDGLQDFAVLRVLKGRVADRIALLVHDGAAIVPAGSLEVLYLRPLRDYVMAGGGELDEDAADASPTPLAASDAVVMPAPSAGYSMGSSDAYVQAVPSGVDVSLLSAP